MKTHTALCSPSVLMVEESTKPKCRRPTWRCIDACCWRVRDDIAAILVGSLCKSIRRLAHSLAKHWPHSTAVHLILEIRSAVLLLALPVILHTFLAVLEIMHAAVLQLRLRPVVLHMLLVVLVPVVRVRAHIVICPTEAQIRSTSGWLDHARCGNVSQHVAVVLIAA